MTSAQELLATQCARFRELDRQLPDDCPLPRDGEPLMARLHDGSAVAALATHTRHPPRSVQRLWSAGETRELFPLLGNRAGEGMDAVLTAWKRQLAQREDVADHDSACVVTWPSRDVRASRALLDHGFAPLTCLAVRPPGSPPPAPESNPERFGTVNVRRAGPADLDAVVELAMAELEYAALVGASVLRPGAAELKRVAVRLRLNTSTAARTTQEGAPSGDTDPVWLAEHDGEPVALAECGWADTRTDRSGHRVRPGLWGYVNCLSVHERHRGTGTGRRLMAVVHRTFAEAGAAGSYLYYNPANPLSSVFWPRQGYRPLWTTWEIRPATALR